MLPHQEKPFILFIIIICLMTLSIIASKTNENIGSRQEVRAFKGMLYSFMAYALVDLRLLFDHFYTSFPRLFVLFVMAVGFSSMSFACYCWFMYVSSSVRPLVKSTKLWNILTAIPLLFVICMLFTPLHIFVYDFDTEPTFKPMLSMIIFMDYVYLIVASGISIYKRNTAKSRFEKKQYSGQLIFILFFTLCGAVVVVLLNLPVTELLYIPVVLKLFVDLQESRIYTDALTKLNNRRRITEYITDELATCNKANPLTIIMLDLDFFKSINDILGHDDGDKALISFSNALRNVLAPKYAIAARWGGDEFVVAGKEKNLEINLREKIVEELKKDPYSEFLPLFSIGVYKCTSPNITYEQALVNADTELYKDKSVQHRKSDAFFMQLNMIKQDRASR